MNTEPMDPAEVLRGPSFDPTPVPDDRQVKVMRLALEMIVHQTAFPDSFAAQIARRTAQQALKECG